MNGNIVDIYFNDKNPFNIVYHLDLHKSYLFRIKTPDTRSYYNWLQDKRLYIGMMLEGVHYIRLYYGEDSILLECVIGDLSFNNFIKMMNEGQKAVDESVRKLFNGKRVPPALAALMIYSFITANVKYDSASYEKSTTALEYHIESWTSYGALHNLKAVCEGYSWAMIDMLARCGIEAQPVFGAMTKGGPLHQWLKVKIDNDWYNIEPTQMGSYSAINLGMFLLSDETLMKKGYVFNEPTNFWPARSKKYEGAGLDKLVNEFYSTICNYGISPNWLQIRFFR